MPRDLRTDRAAHEELMEAAAWRALLDRQVREAARPPAPPPRPTLTQKILRLLGRGR